MIGKIKQINKNNYLILLENGETVVCKLIGNAKQKIQKLFVGDNVEIEYENKIITSLLARKNYFIRPSISNIDQAIIVSSLIDPIIDETIINKLILLFQFNNIKPILLFTKKDLSTNYKIPNLYKELKYLVYIINTHNKLPSDLLNILKNKFTVITGKSGVGKTSLINKLLPNQNLKVQEISKINLSGKHTTTSTTIYSILNYDDSFISDTPGFTSLNLCDFMTVEDISWNFLNFEVLKNKCKMKNCLHLTENNCEIKNQISTNQNLMQMYENYITIINECKN